MKGGGQKVRKKVEGCGGAEVRAEGGGRDGGER